MRESVIYRDILYWGKLQEALSIIWRQVHRRFSEIDPMAIARIQAL